MASEADRLRAMAMGYRNQTLEQRWTFSAQFDLLNLAAQYEQAAATMELADALNRSRNDKNGTP